MSEDHLLKVQDCPNLTVCDWQKAPEGTAENPAVIDEDRESIIEVDSNENGLLYTAKEVAVGVTTDSGVESDERFDPGKEDESDFDNDIDGDEDM
jgi:hypothetical protein